MFFSLFKKFFGKHTPRKSDLDELKEELLDYMIGAFALFGLLPLIAGIIKAYQDEKFQLILFYFFVYLGILALNFLKKYLNLQTKLTIGFLVFFGHGVLLLMKFGLSGAGMLSLMVLSLLSTLFLDTQRGLYAAALSIFTIVLIGSCMVLGVIPFEREIWYNSLSALSWLQAGLLFAVLVAAVVLIHGRIQAHLQKSVEVIRDHSEELIRANERLKAEISQRQQAENDREKLEGQLRQSQKLEAVGLLAGGIAHDFNNFLTIVNGNIAMAKDAYQEGEDGLEYLGEIEQAYEGAEAMVRRLLMFSRKEITEFKATDIKTIIANTHSLLKRSLGEDITLVTQVMENIWPIKADPNHIEQAILNMAVNARDAMPKGGSFTISAKNIALSDENECDKFGVEKGDYIIVRLEDTGHGMSEALQKKIFDPFFTTKPIGKGTGLGLASVLDVMKKHQGAVWVSSKEGLGTSFVLLFPRLQEKEKRRITESDFEAATPLPAGRETILIVEDDETIRKMNERILSRLGYEVFGADNGIAALRIVEAHGENIVLVITDVIMPNMSGSELAEKIKEIAPRIQILFTSGYTQDMIRRYGVNEKEMHFLSKPYTVEILAQKVRHVLDA